MTEHNDNTTTTTTTTAFDIFAQAKPNPFGIQHLSDGIYALAYKQCLLMGSENGKVAFPQIQFVPVAKWNSTVNSTLPEHEQCLWTKPNNTFNVQFNLWLLTYPKDENKLAIKEVGYIPSSLFFDEYVKMMTVLTGINNPMVLGQQYGITVAPEMTGESFGRKAWNNGQETVEYIPAIWNNYDMVAAWASHLETFNSPHIVVNDDGKENGAASYANIIGSLDLNKVVKAYVQKETNEYEDVNGETQSFTRNVVTMKRQETNWSGFVTRLDDFDKEELTNYLAIQAVQKDNDSPANETTLPSPTGFPTPPSVDDIPF